MAAIAGIIYSDPFQSTDHVDKMLAVMKHRGIQSKSTYQWKSIVLGACGSKIFCNTSKNLYVAFDGVITNYTFLQKELTYLGYSFNTNTFEELILHAYEAWGIDFLDKINGDFAGFIWNKKTSKLILVRDRIGKKPLYWFRNDHYFIFASELKALISTGIVSQTPSNEGIASFLTLGFIPQDLSPIKNVNKLLPAHYLQVDLLKRESIHSYWSLSSHFKQNTSNDISKIVSHIDQLLVESTASRIPFEKPVNLGCLISEDISSAAVAYYMTKLRQHVGVSGYSITYQEQEKNKQDFGKQITSILHIPYKKKVITKENFFNDIAKTAWYMDEPLCNFSAQANWQLVKMVSKHTRYLFTGIGGSELLSGYNPFSKEEKKTKLLHYLFAFGKTFLHSMLIPLLKNMRIETAFPILKLIHSHPWYVNYLRKSAIFDPKTLKKISPKLYNFFNEESFFNKIPYLSQISSHQTSLLYFHLKTQLPDCSLLQFERITSAHSITWHTPFLDRHLIEFLTTIAFDKIFTEKELFFYLKKTLSHVYPSHLLNTKQHNCKKLLYSWITKNKILNIFKLLKKSTLIETGIISEKWIDQAISNEKQIKENFNKLNTLIVLEIWFRLYINSPLPQEPPDVSIYDLLS